MTNPDVGFWEAVDEIRARDGRYRREAYGFVMAALGAAVQALPEERRRDPATRHLSGQELLLGVIQLARRTFGRWPEIVASCSVADSSGEFDREASPSPMLSVILSRRGASITLL